MKMFLLHLPARERAQKLLPQGFLDQVEDHHCESTQSALHHAMQIARHASLSAELYVNVAVTLNICCCDSLMTVIKVWQYLAF